MLRLCRTVVRVGVREFKYPSLQYGMIRTATGWHTTVRTVQYNPYRKVKVQLSTAPVLYVVRHRSVISGTIYGVPRGDRRPHFDGDT